MEWAFGAGRQAAGIQSAATVAVSSVQLLSGLMSAPAFPGIGGRPQLELLVEALPLLGGNEQATDLVGEEVDARASGEQSQLDPAGRAARRSALVPRR